MANAIIYTEKVLEATEEIPGREKAFSIFLVKYIEYLPDTNIFGGGCKIVFTSGSDVPANPPLYKIINYSTRMILSIVRLVKI